MGRSAIVNTPESRNNILQRSRIGSPGRAPPIRLSLSAERTPHQVVNCLKQKTRGYATVRRVSWFGSPATVLRRQHALQGLHKYVAARQHARVLRAAWVNGIRTAVV